MSPYSFVAQLRFVFLFLILFIHGVMPYLQLFKKQIISEGGKEKRPASELSPESKNHKLSFKVISASANKNVVFAKGFRHNSGFRLLSVIHYHYHFSYIMLSTFI